MDKLKMHSTDLSQDNIAKIRELFPGCVTEAADENGKLRLAVDFDQLRQELSDSIVEGPQERYHLNWPGKREALVKANAPIAKTLRPCREESVDFDTTQNLFIEGDNLEALKLLQETYLGKVKMIYIDPPYNTGNDFIYRDDFSAARLEHQEKSGERNEVGERLVANVESDGRFHSKWLQMIYSRLRLAKNLLSDDGILFVSIDDNEVANLRRICDEIFGEKNFCAQFIWNTEGNTDNQYAIKVNHEYILAFYRDKEYSDRAIGKVIDPNTPEDSNLRKGFADNNINKNNPENPPAILTLPAGFPASVEELTYLAKPVDEAFFEAASAEKYISDSLKIKYNIEAKSGLPIKLDDLVVENSILTKPCRIFVGMANRKKLQEFISNDCNPVLEDGQPISFYINANAAVRYRKKNEKPRNILSVLRNFGTTEKTKTYLKKMGIFYDYPKPVGLLEYLVKIGADESGLILDFFAGSSSIFEAVHLASCSDGKPRRVVAIQIPENLDPAKKEQKSAYDFCVQSKVAPNLAEISKERIRRAGQKILEGECHPDWNKDVGFRVLKIDTSNMQDVYYTPNQTDQQSLLDAVDNIKSDRTAEDLLFQVLVDWGVDLTLPIRSETIQGKKVFFVDDNALAACFETGVTEDLVKELAGREPLRVVFRDNGFISDAVKINVEQIFKQLSPMTDVKAI